MFKVGDKVRCVVSILELELNKIYTVTDLHIRADEIFVNGHFNSWMPSRFELVEETIMQTYENNPTLDTTKEPAGVKHDSGKPRVSLIPKAALLGAARGLSYGEKKYGTHNFRNGISFSRLADASMRHLLAWMEGENTDPESGLSHLDHFIATAAMLKFMEEHRPNMDDRWLDPMHTLTDDELYEAAKNLQTRGR